MLFRSTLIHARTMLYSASSISICRYSSLMTPHCEILEDPPMGVSSEHPSSIRRITLSDSRNTTRSLSMLRPLETCSYTTSLFVPSVECHPGAGTNAILTKAAFPDVPFLAALCAKMTTHRVARGARFTAVEALSFFNHHVAGLTPDQLSTEVSLTEVFRPMQSPDAC